MPDTLSVYCRSYAPVGRPQDEAVAAARTLEATGTVDDCQVSEWPATVSLSRDCEAVQVYDRITEWADRTDVALDRPFRVHTRTVPVDGGQEDVLRTPVVAIVRYRDGAVAGVAPCTLPDGTHLTARRFLDDLQDDRDPFERATTDAVSA